MGCIEGIQLTIFVELANKLVINEVRHRYIQHARIMVGSGFRDKRSSPRSQITRLADA